MYGAFNCTLFDHQVVHPVVMTLSDVFQDAQQDFGKLEECSVWGEVARTLLDRPGSLLTFLANLGPTCDSIDVVQQAAKLPVDVLSVGDWLRWENMGAYTICAASQVSLQPLEYSFESD